MTPQLPQRRWKPEIHRTLLDMVGRETSEPRVATFDWDNTCVGGDLTEALLDTLDERDGGSRLRFYERALDERGELFAYTWCITALHGCTEQELTDLTAEVVEERIGDGRLAERPEIQDLIELLRETGWDVWVVSASAEISVRVAAERYGLRADRVIGARLAKDEEGRLLPQLDAPLTYRHGKLLAIDRYIGHRPLFAAGDAGTDIEMLDSARYRLVIDRGHEELIAHADAGGWWRQPAWSNR